MVEKTIMILKVSLDVVKIIIQFVIVLFLLQNTPNAITCEHMVCVTCVCVSMSGVCCMLVYVCACVGMPVCFISVCIHMFCVNMLHECMYVLCVCMCSGVI